MPVETQTQTKPVERREWRGWTVVEMALSGKQYTKQGNLSKRPAKEVKGDRNPDRRRRRRKARNKRMPMLKKVIGRLVHSAGGPRRKGREEGGFEMGGDARPLYRGWWVGGGSRGWTTTRGSNPEGVPEKCLVSGGWPLWWSWSLPRGQGAVPAESCWLVYQMAVS